MEQTKRTVNDLREAAWLQKSIGLYVPTERELSPLTWVEANSFTFNKPDLGVILDINKYRHNGQMIRQYMVLTLDNGQLHLNRESLVVADLDLVRKYAGLTPEQDFWECLEWAKSHGKTLPNYYRACFAVAASRDGWFSMIPAKCEFCLNELCHILNIVDMKMDPNMVMPE